jgi:hypothetical protein
MNVSPVLERYLATLRHGKYPIADNGISAGSTAIDMLRGVWPPLDLR